MFYHGPPALKGYDLALDRLDTFLADANHRAHLMSVLSHWRHVVDNSRRVDLFSQLQKSERTLSHVQASIDSALAMRSENQALKTDLIRSGPLRKELEELAKNADGERRRLAQEEDALGKELAQLTAKNSELTRELAKLGGGGQPTVQDELVDTMQQLEAKCRALEMMYCCDKMQG
jgi:hypothetical protein